MLPWDCMDFNRKVAIFVHMPDCFPVGFFHNPSGHWRIWRASKERNTELMGSTFHLSASLSINWSIVASWSKELKWSESIQLGLLTVFPWPNWTLSLCEASRKVLVSQWALKIWACSDFSSLIKHHPCSTNTAILKAENSMLVHFPSYAFTPSPRIYWWLARFRCTSSLDA
jgi:hypothetical protein